MQLSLSTVLAVALATGALIWTVWARQQPAIEVHDAAAIYQSDGQLMTRLHLSHDGSCASVNLRETVVAPDGQVLQLGQPRDISLAKVRQRSLRRVVKIDRELEPGDYEYQALLLCVTATGEQRPYLVGDVVFHVNNGSWEGFGPAEHPL